MSGEPTESGQAWSRYEQVAEHFDQLLDPNEHAAATTMLLHDIVVLEDTEALRQADHRLTEILDRHNLGAEQGAELQVYSEFVQAALQGEVPDDTSSVTDLEPHEITVHHVLEAMRDGGDDVALAVMDRRLRDGYRPGALQGEAFGRNQGLFYLTRMAGMRAHSFQMFREDPDVAGHWFDMLSCAEEREDMRLRALTAVEIGESLGLEPAKSKRVGRQLANHHYTGTGKVVRNGRMVRAFDVSARAKDLLELVRTNDRARAKAGLAEIE